MSNMELFTSDICQITSSVVQILLTTTIKLIWSTN